MKMSSGIIVRVFLVVCLISLLTGCAVLPTERVAGNAIDYNRAVEKAHNEILLLNIVRASQRRPIYFTGFSAMRGNMTNTFQMGTFNIPLNNLGGGLDSAYVLNPSASHSFTPSYDFTVLDSQEFMQGIMKPVPVELIDYYLKQRWPKEMVLHLVVDHAEGLKGAKYINHPEDPEDKEAFDGFRKFIKTCELKYEEKPIIMGTEIGNITSSDLKNLIDIQKAGLTLEQADKKKGNAQAYRIVPKIRYYFVCGGVTFAISSQGEDAISKSVGKIYLRSPEAILHYLGELVSARATNKFEVMITGCPSEADKATLFVVDQAAADDETVAVAVEYEGVKYVIKKPASFDRCTMDRSTHVLAFLSQLIALHKSAKEMPVTGVVEVIGK